MACAFLLAFGLSMPVHAKKQAGTKAKASAVAAAKKEEAAPGKKRLTKAQAKRRRNRKRRRAKAKAKAKAKRAPQTKVRATEKPAPKSDKKSSPTTKTKAARTPSTGGRKRTVKKRGSKKRLGRKKRGRRGRKRTRRPKPKPRQPGSEPGQPNNAARQIVTGQYPNRSSASPKETEELKQLREADGLLFPRRAAKPSASWRQSPRRRLGSVRRRSNGLPASSQAPAKAQPTPAAQGTDVPTWLAKLRKPDFAVRFAPAVVKYLKYYKNTKRGRRLARAFVRKSGRYRTAMHKLLDKHKLPRDLMWLAMIESGFNASIHSHAGAAGLWQFMPATARIYGLTVSKRIDERLDPERATVAALRHLGDLHKRFGTWELAFAAYNMGYGGVLHAIRKFNTNSFWKLRTLEAGLPYETSLYVPKIMALAIVTNNCDVFGCENVVREAPRPFGEQLQDRLSVAPGVSLKQIAKAAKVDEKKLRELNPQLLGSRLPPLQSRRPGTTSRGAKSRVSWPVYLPKGKARRAKGKIRAFGQAPSLASYQLRWGESLEHVALRFRTSVARMQYLNDLHPLEAPRPDQKLFVPAGRVALDDAAVFAKLYPRRKPMAVVPESPAAPAAQELYFYQAVFGDRVEGVARACGVAPNDLVRWNHLDEHAVIQSGMKLRIFLPPNTRRPQAVLLPAKRVLAIRRNSGAFFSNFLYGRRRMKVRVKRGDTWRKIARRYGLSVGMLERINARSRYRKPVVGSIVTVYARRWPDSEKASDDRTQATAKRQATSPRR